MSPYSDSLFFLRSFFLILTGGWHTRLFPCIFLYHYLMILVLLQNIFTVPFFLPSTLPLQPISKSLGVFFLCIFFSLSLSKTYRLFWLLNNLCVVQYYVHFVFSAPRQMVFLCCAVPKRKKTVERDDDT